MKTILNINIALSLGIVLLWSGISQGQTWDIDGNSIAPGEYFGTNNTEPLLFHTDGSLRMTLSTTGKLGLNATPAAGINLRISQTSNVGIESNSTSTGASIAGARFFCEYRFIGNNVCRIKQWGVHRDSNHWFKPWNKPWICYPD